MLVVISDWIQLTNTIILLLTFLGVLWYAWEARKQAKETQYIAAASFRPVLLQWIGEVDRAELNLYLYYWNVGNGAAMNITWQLQPSGQHDERYGMGTKDDKGHVIFTISPFTPPTAVICEYEDVYKKRWRLTLHLTTRGNVLINGRSSLEEVRTST